MQHSRHLVLFVSSYFKGNRTIERAKAEGHHTILLTVENKLGEPWARGSLDEVFALPNFEDRRSVMNAIAYLMRTRAIDRVIALDDFDVELGAAIREHFRLPGLDESAGRLFRDKLAMRVKADEVGITQPAFMPLFHHESVQKFCSQTPGPWMLKPRGSANAIGIKKQHGWDEVQQSLDQVGDEQSLHLLEQMVPGELFHVDSIVAGGKVVFAEVNRYGKPLFDVYHGGGVYTTQTIQRDSADAITLKEINAKLLPDFGMKYGVSHSEFMKSHADGKFYFIETSARVGGSNIGEMVEFATGVNLWSEWAKVEVDFNPTYQPNVSQQQYSGTIISLAKQEWPDVESFTDPEISYRVKKKHHIGFIFTAPTAQRVEELLKRYSEIIAKDYLAVLPAATKATE